MKIYIAGPMVSLSVGEVVSRYTSTEYKLSGTDYTVLLPLYGKNIRNDGLKINANAVQTPQAIFGRDKWMVEQCDIFLADFSQVNNDKPIPAIGTCFEIAWAHLLNKHIIVICRKNSYYDKHPFIQQSAHVVYSTIEEAINYLNILAKGSI